MSDLLDIGNYANDTRLVRHDQDHASFYGERCMPAVYVAPYGNGYRAHQSSSVRGGSNYVAFLPTVFADAPNAVEALRQIIGPVIPR